MIKSSFCVSCLSKITVFLCFSLYLYKLGLAPQIQDLYGKATFTRKLKLFYKENFISIFVLSTLRTITWSWCLLACLDASQRKPYSQILFTKAGGLLILQAFSTARTLLRLFIDVIMSECQRPMSRRSFSVLYF